MRGTQRDRRRHELAREAARLMVDEGVKQYFDAKRMAAKRCHGTAGAKRLRHKPHDLPSNGAIRDAVLALTESREGQGARTERLESMRLVAIEVMESLLPFLPRLIGSVASGHVRAGSDIDLHVFTDDADELFAHLDLRGTSYETDQVLVRVGGRIDEYLHVYLFQDYEVELSVYPISHRRLRPRSSTDGKPIERLSVAAVRELVGR